MRCIGGLTLVTRLRRVTFSQEKVTKDCRLRAAPGANDCGLGLWSARLRLRSVICARKIRSSRARSACLADFVLGTAFGEVLSPARKYPKRAGLASPDPERPKPMPSNICARTKRYPPRADSPLAAARCAAVGFCGARSRPFEDWLLLPTSRGMENRMYSATGFCLCPVTAKRGFHNALQ